MVLSASPLASSAPWRPWWTSPRAPLLPTRQRVGGVQSQASPTLQAATSATKLLPPPPPLPLRCRAAVTAADVALPMQLRSLPPLPPPLPHAAKLPHPSCPRHRRRADAPPPSPPPSHCRCSQAAADSATTAPSWHCSPSAATAASAKLPPLPPRCHHTAKQLLPPPPSCRHCHRCLRHCRTLPQPTTAPTAATLLPPYCRC